MFLSCFGKAETRALKSKVKGSVCKNFSRVSILSFEYAITEKYLQIPLYFRPKWFVKAVGSLTRARVRARLNLTIDSQLGQRNTKLQKCCKTVGGERYGRHVGYGEYLHAI